MHQHAMVLANVRQALPPATDDVDPGEDEHVWEPAWPHLQVAYEFSSKSMPRPPKNHADLKFCLELVELFDSGEPPECDYLKTILHCIYGEADTYDRIRKRAKSGKSIASIRKLRATIMHDTCYMRAPCHLSTADSQTAILASFLESILQNERCCEDASSHYTPGKLS